MMVNDLNGYLSRLHHECEKLREMNDEMLEMLEVASNHVKPFLEGEIKDFLKKIRFFRWQLELEKE